MKRMRDDVGFGSSQFKRPVASSRGESYGQSQVPGGGGGGGNVLGTSGAVTGASQKLTTNDALSYLKEVKDMFQDQREKYDTFLEVMKDFKAQRTDTAGVIARVKELFKGHNNLIYGFNTFLPKGYEITLDEVETPPKKTVEFEEAISFVNKIKKRFQNDEHVYKSFLDILNMYRKEHKDITEVYSEVASLFEDHPDLLDEFTRFLPDNSVTSATHQVPYGRNANQRYNERNPAAPSLRQMHMEKQRRRERMLTSHGERDLSVDRPEMDDDKLMTKVKDQRKRSEKDVRDRRNRDLDDREPEQDSTRDIGMQRYNDKKPVRKVEGFGMNSNFASFDDRGMYNQALVFCDKVKEKLGSSDDYQAFLKCLNIFNSGIIKRNELQNLVADLIGKFPDLMEEFNDFLERCENIDGFLTGVMSKRTMATDGHVAKPLKIEDKDREPKRELDVPKEKDRYKEKYMKCVNDLDLSNCQRCTPSYRLLPDDYPIPTASQKSELGAQVLNDYWVSVTSGSEDYSFKHMRKNQYEESLFRCEDDRFELDLLLESVSSTAKRAEELLNIINENKVGTVFRIEDHFTALNLRCIERLYGDHGLDVMDILRRNPPVALPVVLTRLKQKQDEWTTCRSDFNKVWAEIYAKNHYKSLDHRSFYFKQQDSKNLSTKSLVAEIKELKEKQQKEDDVLLAFAAGNRQTVVPHLQFEYSDVSIHKDLSKLVQYSCEEVCSTKEQLSKVMRLWTMFMETILGASRLNGTEKSHNNGKGGQPTDCTTSTAAENGAISHIDPTPSRSKLPKLATNFDETASPDPQNLFRTRSVNGSVTAKEDGQLLLALTSKEDANSSIPPLEKQQNGLDMTDRVSGLISMQAASDLNSNVSAMVGGENNHGRSDIALAGSDSTLSTPAVASCEDHKVKAGNDVAGPSSMNGIVAKSVLSASGMHMDGSKVGRYAAEPNVPSKIEKEEGELSPNGEFEDFGISPEGKYNVERQHHELGNGEELRSHDPDADDEDSDNASEPGDDASGSESAGDECSREEDEDAEHDEVDGKAESEGEADGTADAQFSGGDAHVPERFFSSVRPLVKHFPPSVLNEERKRDTHIFYGNDDFYVLFRLHQILYERILSAKINSTAGEMKWRTSKDSDSDPYGRFMSALYNLLDGSFDNAKFEDECRAILGNQSYVLFTLDKLLYKLIKQLQTVAGDEMDNKLLQLYEYEKSRKAGKFVDTVYYDNARYLLYEENIYRLEFSSVPCRTSIQLMDNINEKPEVLAVSMDPDFAAYLHNDFLSLIPGKKEVQGITLQRNKRKYASTDELSALTRAMEGVKMHNGLECKISCNSCKISYVLDTEDFFFRVRRRKSSQGHDQLQKRVQRFRKFLSAS